jgi:NAD(P)-dependent dehydrogenase (short-subunit alcohol dehydrogenase family)
MFNISGKNAFITGGTSGLGLETAKRFVKAGAHVTICGRRSNGQSIADDIGATFEKLDVTNSDDLKMALERCSEKGNGIDIVFNNAGFMDAGPLIKDATTDSFRNILETNLIAVYDVMSLCFNLMSSNSSIINTSSIAAKQTSIGYSRYSATKAAVSSLTKSAAIEFGEKGIRVNAIAPGSTWSEMLPPEDLEAIVAKKLSPTGRIGNAQDIAALVHFLASDDAIHINGSEFTIDAGATAGLSTPLIMSILKDQ